MAMALLDAGVPADRFRIDAVDVSARVLIARAQRAVYGKNSFRGQELTFRDRHFEAATHGHRLRRPCAGRSSSGRATSCAADFLPGRELYDVIFCRNLLIYFDRPTQDRAIAVAATSADAERHAVRRPSRNRLAAESRLRVGEDAAGVRVSKSSRRVAPAEAGRRPTRPGTRKPLLVAAPVSARQAPGATPAAGGPQPIQPSDQQAGDPGLDQAVRLADQGRFVEAASCCDEHLRRHGPSAKAFYLLGLVRRRRQPDGRLELLP